MAARVARRLDYRRVRVRGDVRSLRRQGGFELILRSSTTTPIAIGVGAGELGLLVAVKRAKSIVELVELELLAGTAVRERERTVREVHVQLLADGARAVRRVSSARRGLSRAREVCGVWCATSHGTAARRGRCEERKAEHVPCE